MAARTFPPGRIRGSLGLGQFDRLGAECPWHALDEPTQSGTDLQLDWQPSKVQLLGHATTDRTLRYLGVYIEDALSPSKQIDLAPLRRPSNSVSLSPRQLLSPLPFCVHDPVAVFVAPLAAF